MAKSKEERSKQQHENYIKNKEAIQERHRAYKLKNKEAISKYTRDNYDEYRKQYHKEYYEKHKNILKEKKHEYYKNNFERFSKLGKEYAENNKEITKEYQRAYRIAHKDKLRADAAKRASENREKCNIYQRAYLRKKLATDDLFKLTSICRTRIKDAFRSAKYRKRTKASILMGAEMPFIKKYLESLFTKGMSWDKMGSEIHIDHIIPLSSAKTEEDMIRLFHYRNLQPLWKHDNLVKSNKITKPQLSLTI